MNAAITLRHVTFSYPRTERPAIHRVGLDIPRGSFVLVTGETGSGKSTLLRAMNGLVPHFTGGTFSGSVSVEGRDTIEHPPRRLADVVAFVPQNPSASFVVDRVEDELAYAMENLAVDPAKMRRRTEELLDLLDIAALRDRSVRSLSGGEKQRVAIGAALTPGAKVLLLDEPTSQLDPQGAEDVLGALQRLVHDLGYTIVLAEHRLERVVGFVDVALGCRAGEVISGTPTEVLSELDTGPPVTRLGRMLGWDPVPLTVRDARRAAEAVELPDPVARVVTDGSESRLVATELDACYDELVALRRVSLGFASGEIVAVLGRNGAGKSTLLRCLAGLHAPSSGRVSFDHRRPRPGKDVGLCPQTPDDILFSESVLHEVLATLKGAGSSEDAGAYLRDLGIGHLAERHPRDLSAGQRLLVAIAAVAATDAPVLLLDEPTRGLDAETKEMLGRVMEVWAAEGRIVIFATHDVELAAELAARVIVLASGEIVSDGTPADVLSDSHVFSPQMTRVFGPGWLTPRQVATAAGVS